MSDPFTDCWFLSGATATGKTGVALALAERLGAEIVSLDSMTIYRGMDIGTAKPTADERARRAAPFARHRRSGGRVQRRAVCGRTRRRRCERFAPAAARCCSSAGRRCISRACCVVCSTGRRPNWELREEIEAELEQVGQAALHERLTQVDPVAASAIHPHDTRRMIRALEVYRATGEPLSHQQMQFDDGRRGGRVPRVRAAARAERSCIGGSRAASKR